MLDFGFLHFHDKFIASFTFAVNIKYGFTLSDRIG
jgi:hypothetical protein